MKKTLAMILSVIMLCTLLVGCGGSKEAAPAAAPAAAPEATPAASAAANQWGYDVSDCEPIEILFAHASEQNQIDTKYTEVWLDMVTERSDGKITFQYSHSGEMGTLAELTEALESGIIDMSKPDIGMFADDVPAANITSMPFMIKDWDHAQAVWAGEPGKYIAKELLDGANVVMLNMFITGFRCYATTTPINQLSDTKGILMRTPEIEIYMSTNSILGFSPTPISYNEMYNALSQGVVDGIDSAPLNTYEGGYHKLAPYIWYSRQMGVFNFIGANADFWNSLPDVYKQIMMDCAAEVTPLQVAESREKELGFLDLMESEGATITYPDDYYDEIVALFQDYWAKKIADIGGDAQKIVDEIQALAS